MAVRHRPGRASPWECYWNNPFSGKRECAYFATEQEAKKHDSLVKHRLKFERESFKKDEASEEGTEALTLETAYLLYLRQKRFNRKAMNWQMDAMRLPLKKLGNLPLAKILPEHLSGILAEHQKADVKPATVRGRMSVLRTVLRWCEAQGFMPPVRFPKLPPAHYERFIPPTSEELGAIMAHASPHIVRVIVLGAQFGVRVGPSELLQLTWEDVDLIRGVVRVHGARKNLSAPWREVPIKESLLPVFEAWHKEDSAADIRHVIHHRGRPISSIKTAWAATLRRAGITRRIRPYDLRHAFATEAIAAGADVGTVARLMGHSSPAMILGHYQYVLDTQKRAAVESLPDLSHVAETMWQKKSTFRKFP